MVHTYCLIDSTIYFHDSYGPNPFLNFRHTFPFTCGPIPIISFNLN